MLLVMVGLYAGFTAPAAVEQPQRPFPNLSWLANWTMVYTLSTSLPLFMESTTKPLFP